MSYVVLAERTDNVESSKTIIGPFPTYNKGEQWITDEQERLGDEADKIDFEIFTLRSSTSWS